MSLNENALKRNKDDWKDIENDGKGQKYENDPREALFRLPDENDWKWSKMTGTTGRGQNTGTTRRHFESDWTLFNHESESDSDASWNASDFM